MTVELVHRFIPSFTWENHKWRLAMIEAMGRAGKCA